LANINFSFSRVQRSGIESTRDDNRDTGHLVSDQGMEGFSTLYLNDLRITIAYQIIRGPQKIENQNKGP